MTPEQYCQKKAGGSGSSFYYSFLFLPPEKRRAITALYAFCREVDDVVDECQDPGVARVKLDWWRAELGRAFAGRPEHPVTRALAPAAAAYGLPQEQFLEIIAGMEMDLVPARYRTFEELRRYCHRVASVVGLLSAAIFGYRDPGTRAYAADLGIAFQLTNIIRDVGEDARRNRIYLPAEDLERFDVSAADILNGRETENFKNLLAFEAERALAYYRKAEDALPEVDRARQLPGLIMAQIYRATLEEIRHDGYRVLDRKVLLTPLRKLWLAWTAYRRERRRARRAARAA